MKLPSEIIAHHGDTLPFELSGLIGFDGAPIASLSGWGFIFTVKACPTDPDPGILQKSTASGSITIQSAAAYWEISATENRTALTPGKTYPFDVQATDPQGRVATVSIGAITILRDITQS